VAILLPSKTPPTANALLERAEPLNAKAIARTTTLLRNMNLVFIINFLFVRRVASVMETSVPSLRESKGLTPVNLVIPADLL